MSLAMFKLESFSTTLPGQATDPVYDRSAIDQAFADGVADGMSRKEDEQLRHLGAGLSRLAQALGDDAARREELRAEAVASLAPILEAILDGLAPAAESPRLEKALCDELTRLAQSARPLTARIACNQRLRGLVDRCLAEAGIEGIEIADCTGDRISLSLQGGRIEFAPDRVTEDIRALISELRQDDSSWTH